MEVEGYRAIANRSPMRRVRGHAEADVWRAPNPSGARLRLTGDASLPPLGRERAAFIRERVTVHPNHPSRGWYVPSVTTHPGHY